MDRISQKVITLTDQTKVDAPGIDAHSFKAWPFGSSLAEGDFHLVEQPDEIPVQRIEQTNRPVGKPVNFLQPQAFAIKLPEKPAAALAPRSRAR